LEAYKFNTDEQAADRIKVVNELLESGRIEETRQLLKDMHPAEIAHLLQSLPRERREIVWDLVDPRFDGDVLLHVNEDVRSAFIRDMDASELVSAAENLDTDDLADIFQDLPEEVGDQLLDAMSSQDRARLQAVLSYPEDTAGGLMNTDTVSIRPDVTFDVVLRYLRLRGSLPETTDSLFVVDRQDRFLGLLPITDLLVRPPETRVSAAMKTHVEAIPATMSAHEVAAIFERRDLVSAPVVDEDNRLLGRITIDDVVDVIREEADRSFMNMAGLNEEEDMFAPVVTTARRRGVWLGVNLLTALLASWVISLFDQTIERLVALAVLMPIVASMGGIAGSQTLTIVIRGIALGHISKENASRLLAKEVAVGVLNGLMWAVIIGAVTWFWIGGVELAVIIGLAIIANLLVAAFFGATIPLILKKLGADPALGGSVLLTTVTDVVGFLAFLGLATALLL